MALLAALVTALPMALDGESVAGNSTGLAVIAAVSMAAGYIVLAALWYFVFSKRARRKRGERDPGD
jgi:hypothetical protein